MLLIVVFTRRKELGVIDPQMAKAVDYQRIAAWQRVSIHDGVRHNPFLLVGQQGGRLGIGDHDRIDLSTPI